MNLIVLPGNSLRNREWGTAAARAYQGQFAEIYEHDYLHWQNGAPVIDMTAELPRLAAKVAEWSNEEYRVCAKSAGSLLTMLATSRGQLTPSRCLFAGLPLDWEEAKNWHWEEWVKPFMVPTVIIQNDRDPYAPAAGVAKMISALGKTNFQLIETAGNNHDYLDFDLINRLSNNFLTK